MVRLFSIPSGVHVCTFRRGSRPADIHCLSFSNDSSLLAACSSSGTVHIFDVYSALHTTPSESVSNKQPKSRSQSSESLGSSGAAEGWTNSWTSSAYTYLSMAQSWGTAAVSGLNVLPEPLQEYANSIRLVCLLVFVINQSQGCRSCQSSPHSFGCQRCSSGSDVFGWDSRISRSDSF